MTTEYIRDAQDYTLQKKRQLIYLDFSLGVPINHVPNGNASYLTFLFGAKECRGSNCPGSTLHASQAVLPRLFR